MTSICLWSQMIGLLDLIKLLFLAHQIKPCQQLKNQENKEIRLRKWNKPKIKNKMAPRVVQKLTLNLTDLTNSKGQK